MITSHDGALIGSVWFSYQARRGPSSRSEKGSNPFNVKFQFPPKIVSDSRKGDWVEAPLRGNEPVAVYAVSGPREITLQWTYIVGGKSDPPNYAGSPNAAKGGIWTPEFVAQQVSALRAYFSSVASKDFDDALIVKFKMWSHGPNTFTGADQEPFTCRILSVDVTHGTTLVSGMKEVEVQGEYISPHDRLHTDPEFETTTESFRTCYPLRTDITVELRLWTQGGTEASASAARIGAAGKSAEEGVIAEDSKLALEKLRIFVSPEWQ